MDERMRGLVLGFTNPVEIWGLLDQGLEGRGSVNVCVSCVDDSSRYLYIVLGGYLRILGAPSVQSCCTLWISASYCVFVYGTYRKSDLFVCGCRTWICLDITRFYEGQCQPSSETAWPTCPKKNGNSGPPIAVGGRFSTQFCTAVCNRCDSSTASRAVSFWSHLHVVFVYLRVSFVYLRVSLFIFMCLCLSPCVFVYIHVSLFFFVSLFIFMCLFFLRGSVYLRVSVYMCVY